MSRRIEGVFVACRSICRCAILAVAFAFSGALPAHSEVFDIPAQPLATAIDAFCAATGAEVYYDGAIARGRQSSPVSGERAEGKALRALLAGTDLVPMAVRSGVYLLINPGDDAIRAIAAAQLAQDARYHEYFAALQKGLLLSLCGVFDRMSMPERMVIRLWIDGTGAVSRLEPGRPGDIDHSISELQTSLRGVRLHAAPPAHMPQPVTVALLPNKAVMASYCSPAATPPEH